MSQRISSYKDPHPPPRLHSRLCRPIEWRQTLTLIGGIEEERERTQKPELFDWGGHSDWVLNL